MELTEVKTLLGQEEAQYDNRYLKYAVKRPSWLKRLRDAEQRFVLINAPRGAGKSALLLSHEEDILRLHSRTATVLRIYNAQLAWPTDADSFEQCVRHWTRELLMSLGREIARKLDVARTADEVALCDHAERVGWRTRHPAALPASRHEQTPLDEAILRRLVDTQTGAFWVLLDEMDANYSGRVSQDTALVALLQAGKQLAWDHRNVRVRCTLRPHILTRLQATFDVAQKFRSDEMPLAWDAQEIRSILQRRIEYFDGAFDPQQIPLQLSAPTTDGEARERHCINVLQRYFDDFDLSFSDGRTSKFRALHTLSFGRPRWMIEFCHLALTQSPRRRASLRDIKKAMLDYSNNRIKFLSGEHRHHFPELEQVFAILMGVRHVSLGNHESLRDILLKEVIPRLRIDPAADYPSADARALEIANKLYMLDVIRAKQVRTKKDYRFIYYVDKPFLLSGWTPEPKTVWELHPVFSRGLDIEDSNTFKKGSRTYLFGERTEADAVEPDESA